MPRKIFISFLGTSDYVKCNYYLENNSQKIILDVKYIQEACIKLLCADFKEQDCLYFFVTDEAEKKNWLDDGHRDPSQGLCQRLQDINSKAKIEKVHIPEGFSSEEIWKIFDKVYSIFQEDDEVILDITHAFRSLPMLGVVLLNYAKTIFNIKIRGIHYGAFEKLGPAFEVKNKPIEERNAPILNLVTFSLLQDWTKAADIFLKYGNSKALAELTNNDIKPFLIEAKGSNEVLNEYKKFSDNLKKSSDILLTCRGKHIFEGQVFVDLKLNLEKIKDSTYIAPLKGLFGKIENKVVDYKIENIENGFIAVKWCIDHEQVQQGLTILQENTLSLICETIKEGSSKDFKSLRPKITKLLTENKHKQSMSDTSSDCNDDEIRAKFEKNELVNKLKESYNNLTDYRNDINHNGMRENDMKPDRLKASLDENYEKILKVYENFRPSIQ